MDTGYCPPFCPGRTHYTHAEFLFRPDTREEREEELDGAGSEPARRDPKEGLR